MKKWHYFIVILLFIGILIPIIAVSFSGMSLVNDGTDWILNALSKFSNDTPWWGCPFPHRARKIILIMQAIPINIAYFVFKADSLKSFVQIFACSLISIPVILCFYSAFLFYRAKKFYLSVFPIVVLAAVVFPLIIYGVVEAYIAGFLFFILFQYFLLNLELKMYDKIILFFLCITVYYSHEAIVIFAPLFWLTYFKYTDKNSKIMKFCLINTFFAVIEMFIFAYTPFGPNILDFNAANAPLQFLYPPLFWHDMTGIVLNFYAVYFLIFTILFLLCFIIKSVKFHFVINSLVVITYILLQAKFFNFTFPAYRFVSLYFTIAVMILTLIFIKKEEYIKNTAKRFILLIFSMLIITNIFLINMSKEFIEYNKKLVEAAEKGYFYYNQNLSMFDSSEFRKYLIYGHLEQLAYSTIAINSIKNNNVTRGIILGERKFQNPILFCPINQMLNVEG